MSTVSSLPTASALADDIAQRRISSVEAIEASIARIEFTDRDLNAVVVRDFDRARAAACDADAAIARGERRPLLGVPITVKESYDVAGLPKTWGFPWFADHRSNSDAVAVERLRAAGAIVLGKTNVPFALADWQSYNDIYGTTNNPWKVDRTPGGSSGGSAVSVAVGNVPLELGSDIGGSLRAPAHFCGVYSHKPSRGVIPSRGHLPPMASGGTPDLSVCGPLARTVADLTLAFETVAGVDILEAAAPRALPAARHEKISAFRVLALDTHTLMPSSRAVRGALANLVERLRASGARVETQSDLLPNLVDLGRAYLGLLMPFIFARMPPEGVAPIAEAARELAPDDDTPKAWSLRGAIATYRDYLIADSARMRFAYEWHELFRHFDVVLFPPMPTTAFVQDQSEINDRMLDVDGTAYPYSAQTFYASLATPAGLPATTVPIEIADDGLPAGVQIIGPHLEDRTTLEFARLLEAEYGGFTPPPAYA